MPTTEEILIALEAVPHSAITLAMQKWVARDSTLLAEIVVQCSPTNIGETEHANTVITGTWDYPELRGRQVTYDAEQPFPLCLRTRQPAGPPPRLYGEVHMIDPGPPPVYIPFRFNM